MNPLDVEKMGPVGDPSLERLLTEVAQPVIEPILARYTRSRTLAPIDAEDVESAVNVRLIGKLRRMIAEGGEAVADFEKYVATITYNAISDHLRRRFPQRARLKNRLRYVVAHDQRFEVWMVAGETVCGLRGWTGTRPALREAPVPTDVAGRLTVDSREPAEALAEVLEHAGQPVWLNSIVSVIAEAWNVSDVPSRERPVALPSPGAGTLSRMETREFLQALWREVQALRPMQRQALLLNLRDDESVDVISVLVRSGIADHGAIAHAMEMTAEELSAIWNDLPLDDLTIAARLGITRQQVINLRKSARERLRRRMGR
ncbi:MAG: hypothetical protein QOH21_1842 [Acidobacteriota bacterium]|nr:hypothetical protein [Acidobacteriota bacterium]